MRNSLKTVLFVSAFSPSLISVALARIWDRGPSWESAYYGVAGLLGALSARYIIDALRWHGETFSFSAKKIESNDALMLGVIATYFIPFIGKAADITIGIILIFLALACTALWFSSSILPNPLLRVLGYRFYKVESANGVVYTVIAQRDLLSPGDIRKVKRISGSMLVEIV